ncbi:MAG TPA: hypothetical protein DHN33_04845 [Eubacteriaceae bacterium]|nr:hypothetical protein [Eubacteriaceae bacterium]
MIMKQFTREIYIDSAFAGHFSSLFSAFTFLFVVGTSWLVGGVQKDFFHLSYQGILLFTLCLGLITVLHELLHFLGFLLISKHRPKDVRLHCSLREGIISCHSKIPVQVGSHRKVLLLPFLLLGILPLPLALFSNHFFFSALVAASLSSSSYDLLLALRLKSVEDRSLLLDHPSLPGFYVYDGRQPEIDLSDYKPIRTPQIKLLQTLKIVYVAFISLTISQTMVFLLTGL